MNEPIAIYGWFDRRNRCRYVGQSVDPKSRKDDHLKEACKNRHLFRRCSFRVIRWARCVDDANRIERQVTLAFKRMGQADRSKALLPSCGPCAVNMVYWRAGNEWFASFAACARRFNTSPQAIRESSEFRVLWWHEQIADVSPALALEIAEANPDRMYAHKPWLYDQWKDHPAAIALRDGQRENRAK